jgi:hypothetical protein
MTERVVGVLAWPDPELPAALASALLEDVIDLVSEMPMVTPMVATPSVRGGHDPGHLTWPTTAVIDVTERAGVAEALMALAGAAPGAVAVTLLAPDVPDLPALLVGKLFSAVAGRRRPVVAVCPARGGGAVAVAAAVPLPGWLAASRVRLDDADALDRLRADAPQGGVVVVPGWHRIRTLADLSLLDPALEGWDATRAYLLS